MGLTSGEAAGLAGSISNAGGNIALAKGNKKEREWAEGQNQKAFDFQERMWNQTNLYNSAEQQMARLKAAGLNPNLVYGSGGATGGTASPVSAPSQIKLGNPVEGMNFGGHVAEMYDISMKEQQKDLVAMEMLAKSQQIAESVARTKTIEGVRDNTIEEKHAAIQKNYASTENQFIKTAQDAQRLKVAYSLEDTNVEYAKELLRKTKLSNEGQIIQNLQMPEKHKQMLMESVQRIKAMKSTMSNQEIQRELDREKLRMRQNGIETSDAIWNRIYGGAIPTKEEFEKTTGWKI